MNVFGVGLPEIAVIGALALIVFGPKRLPELGRTLGKTLKGFQAASNEFEKEIQKAMKEPASEDTSEAAQNENSLTDSSSSDLNLVPKKSKSQDPSDN